MKQFCHSPFVPFKHGIKTLVEILPTVILKAQPNYLVLVPDAHANTRKGFWANAFEFLTKQEVCHRDVVIRHVTII